jgi:hypothetical protein
MSVSVSNSSSWGHLVSRRLDNIKTDLREKGSEGVDWIHLD